MLSIASGLLDILRMGEFPMMVIKSDGLRPSRASVVGWLVFTVLICLYCLMAFWVLDGHPQPGWFSDSIFYLATADIYSGNLSPAAANFATEFYRASRYPPLFPFFIALFGGGLEHTQLAYLAVQGFGLLAVIAVFVWFWQRSGSVLVAALAIPVAIFSPELFYINLEILSEGQFIFWSVLVFVLACAYERKQCALVTLCMFASLAPLSRTAGIGLLIALTLWLLAIKLRDPLWHRLMGAVFLWVPTILWRYYRSKFPVELDYVADLKQTFEPGLMPWFGSIVERLSVVLDGVEFWFALGKTPYLVYFLLPLLVLAFLGWAQRIRRFTLDAVFLPIYLGLVLVWPYPYETARLLMIAMPIIAMCAVDGVRWAGDKLKTCQPGFIGSNSLVVGLIVVADLLAVPKWLDIYERVMAPLEIGLHEAMRSQAYFRLPLEFSATSAGSMTRVKALIHYLPNVVEEGECVWTPFYALTAYFSGFKTKLNVTPDGIVPGNAGVKLGRCRYIVLISLNNVEKTRAPMYPINAVGYGKLVLYSSAELEINSGISGALVDLGKKQL